MKNFFTAFFQIFKKKGKIVYLDKKRYKLLVIIKFPTLKMSIITKYNTLVYIYNRK